MTILYLDKRMMIKTITGYLMTILRMIVKMCQMRLLDSSIHYCENED